MLSDSDPAGKLSQTIEADSLAQTIEQITAKGSGPNFPVASAPPPVAVESASAPAAGRGPGDGVSKPAGQGSVLAGPPSRIGRYLVLRALGEGGMGVVYAGYDEELDRKVAIKLLHPAQQGDSQLRARIVREAQSLARISAPNVVHVYEVGEIAGQLFISMEFVNGTTLTRWQAEPGRSWKDLLRMYCAAGQGLLDAHTAGLVHRDFKPDNVLLGQDGRPRVADFGLARLQTRVDGLDKNAPSPLSGAVSRPDDSNPMLNQLTQAGVVMGTPLYMAPEQHLGEVADSRTDQFSFCVALYEALYHQLPFDGANLQQLAISKLKGNVVPRPASSNVPAPVHDALLRGLAKTPDQRFPSMRELLAALKFDPTSDTASTPYAMRWVAVCMSASVFLYMLGLYVLRRLGVSALTSSVAASGVLFSVCCLLPTRFRRTMATNRFHRGVMIIGSACMGQLFWLRVIGIMLGLNLTQIMTLDLVVFTATAPILGALALPSMWIFFPISAISAVIAAAKPEYAQPLASVVTPLVIMSCMIAWYRTVRSRVQTKKAKREPEF